MSMNKRFGELMWKAATRMLWKYATVKWSHTQLSGQPATLIRSFDSNISVHNKSSFLEFKKIRSMKFIEG